MNRYSRVILTTVEEDFRAIGLLPQLNEADDPTKPRDIPSPDPDTLAGLDDSEGDKAAHKPGAKQPKPKMGPADDDAEMSGYDPDEDGGGDAQKGGKGGYHKVAGGKEASLKGESAAYSNHPKKIMKAKGKNAGEKAVIAKGLPVTKKIGGMEEGRSKFSKATSLIEEVQGLLYSAQIDEQMDELMHGFRLVAEDSALLADRLTEVSDRYRVAKLISAMESLSSDAVEVLNIIENEIETGGDDADEASAVQHSSNVDEEMDEDESDRDADKPYDVPSPAFKEQSEKVLHAMVSKLMDTLESYDGILDDMGEDMGMDMEDAEDGDDAAGGHEVHVHTKAAKVHIHHGDDDDADDDDGQGDEQDDGGMEHGDEHHMAADDDGSDDDMDHDDMGDDDGSDDDSDHESDHEGNSLMARMKALKARREAMGGGRSFPHGEEESY